MSESPSKHAVIIGVNNYHESLGSLQFCVNDAKLLRETLISDQCGFPPENILLLTDDQSRENQPTFGNIHSWLGTWLQRPRPNDVVLFYFAGHGCAHQDSAFLAPADATLETLSVTGIPIEYMRGMLERCAASQKVLILDACHSGAGRDVAVMSDTFRKELDRGKGLYTIASCDNDQISYEWPEKQNGIFTWCLTESIRETATPETDGRVTLDSVYETTRRRVIEQTSNRRLKQEPVRICKISGQISIASRKLSTEQRLQHSEAEVKQLREQLTEQHNENKQLRSQAEENAKNAEKRAETEQALGQAKAENETIKAELRKLKKRLDKNSKRAVPAKVPEWETWFENAKIFDSDGLYTLYLVSGVGGVGIGAGVSALFSSLGCPREIQFLMFVFTMLVFFGLGGVVHWQSVERVRNRYRLACARTCLQAGDLVGAANFALPMTRAGVDESVAGSLLMLVAELALDSEEEGMAKTVLKRAKERWNSAHAESMLDELK